MQSLALLFNQLDCKQSSTTAHPFSSKMRYSTFLLGILLIFILISGANSEFFLQNWLSSPLNETEMSRRRKKGGKYLITVLFAALMMKAIVFPLAFKVMAVMSSISVLLSTMSLIMSSIVGYTKIASKTLTPPVKVFYKHPHSWAKDDNFKKYYSPVENYDTKALPVNEPYGNGGYIPQN